jgi:guanidinopropionase
MPGTGTPEIGGLTTREALSLVRGLRGLNFIGGDVVEVSPPFDPSGNTALVGATLMYEILCLLTETSAKQISSRLALEPKVVSAAETKDTIG